VGLVSCCPSGISFIISPHPCLAVDLEEKLAAAQERIKELEGGAEAAAPAPKAPAGRKRAKLATSAEPPPASKAAKSEPGASKADGGQTDVG
jgi:hypothetical protein